MAAAFTLTWIPPLETRQSNLRAFMESGVYESIGRLASDAKQELLDRAREYAPKRRGAYAAALTSRQAVAGKGVKVSIYGDAPLSTWIIQGTRPHVIVPVRARALHWTDAGGSHFAKRVQHPGTKANPYPERAIEASADMLYDRARDWGRGVAVLLRAS